MFGAEVSVAFAVELLELAQLLFKCHLREQCVDLLLDRRCSLGKCWRSGDEKRTEKKQQ
jgi:hypothetical protein